MSTGFNHHFLTFNMDILWSNWWEYNDVVGVSLFLIRTGPYAAQELINADIGNFTSEVQTIDNIISIHSQNVINRNFYILVFTLLYIIKHTGLTITSVDFSLSLRSLNLSIIHPNSFILEILISVSLFFLGHILPSIIIKDFTNHLVFYFISELHPQRVSSNSVSIWIYSSRNADVTLWLLLVSIDINDMSQIRILLRRCYSITKSICRAKLFAQIENNRNSSLSAIRIATIGCASTDYCESIISKNIRLFINDILKININAWSNLNSMLCSRQAISNTRRTLSIVGTIETHGKLNVAIGLSNL